MKKPAIISACILAMLLQGCGPVVLDEADARYRTAAPPASPSASFTALTPPPFTPTASPTASVSAAAAASLAPQLSPSSSASDAPTAPPFAGEAFVVRCDTPLTLRASPAPSAKAVAALKNGERVTVTGYEGAFAQVAAGSRTGYVLSGYLAAASQDPTLASLDVVKPVEAYSYDQMSLDLKALAGLYPGKLSLENAGTSLEGRDLPVAVLGDPAAPVQVFVQGSIHARENMTVLLLMAQIECCLKFGSAPLDGGTVGQWLDGVCLRVLPMANPDGVTISESAEMTPALQAIYAQDRKRGFTKLSAADYLRTWKANAAGVDINRNFPAGWEQLDSTGGPSSMRYRGAAPGDQPETKALMAYTQKYKFAATVSYHATGGNLYWQYGANQAVNDRSHSLALAVRSCTQYTLQTSDGLDSGGYKDWAMDALGIPSVTIEIGSRECPLPLDEFSTVWDRNRNVLAEVCRWAKMQEAES